MTNIRVLNPFAPTRRAKTKSNIKIKKGIETNLMDYKKP